MWGAIISGILGLAKAGYGAYQKNKAKQDAKNNVMPPYQASSLYGDTLGVAQQQASFGLSPEALNAYTQTSQQNLASGTENILRGGGDINAISKLYGIDNNARQNLAIENDKLKFSKLQNLFDQLAQYAGQKAMEWRLNYFDRWKDRAVASASLLQNGNNLMSSGFDTLGSSASQFGNLASAKQIPTAPQQNTQSFDYLNGGQSVENNNNYMNWFGQNQSNFSTPQLNDPNNYNPNLYNA